jgi:hypothetical protein
VLASVYGATGRRAEADRLHREVIAILGAKFGKHHSDSARARIDLAQYLRPIGRNQAAIVITRRLCACASMLSVRVLPELLR